MAPLGENMRDGPPSAADDSLNSSSSQHYSAPTSSFSSTSTLLKEISALRLRLKDLEAEDARSSVVVPEKKESELVEMLRKDLAQVELEKATMEKDFMNQLASIAVEHQTKLKSMEKKLDESEAANKQLNEKLIAAAASEDSAEADRYLRLLEEERENHSIEIEKMKENLAHTDMEIAESRREMDNLEERVFELETEKEAILEENATLRLNNERRDDNTESLEGKLKQSMDKTKEVEQALKTKDEVIRKKQEEIGEMNDTIIVLEEHKQMLVSENTDVRMQLAKAEEENAAIEDLRKQVSRAEENNATLDDVRKQLARAKEDNASLKDEIEKQKASQREESGRSREDNNSTAPTEEDVITAEEKDRLEKSVTDLEARIERFNSKLNGKEKKIDTLSASLDRERRLNVELRAEIRRASVDKEKEQKNTNDFNKGQTSELSFLRSQNAALKDEVKSLRRRGRPNVLSSRTAPCPGSPSRAPSPLNSSVHSPPRDARRPDPMSPKFSGIVANFERRIASHHGGGTARPQYCRSPSLQSLNTYSSSFDHGGSQATSQSSIEDAHQLQLDLDKERETVRDLRLQLKVESERVGDLRTQLDKATKSCAKSNSENNKELELLRSQLKESDRAKGRLEDELQAERNTCKEMRSSFEEERKTFETRIFECQRHLDNLSLSQQDEKKEEEYEEEVHRLRSTVVSLRTELQSALEEIDRLEDEAHSLKRSLHEAEKNRASSRDSDMDVLKAQIGKLEVEKTNVERKLSSQIADLENEIGVIELAAEEELQDKEMQIEKLTEEVGKKEQEVARLENERTQLCSSMNDVSISRKDEIDSLQAELVDMGTKTSTQAREIAALKMKLEGDDGDSAAKLKNRIKELEEELKVLNWTSRNQVHQGDIEALTKENNKLRDCVRQVKMERRQLQDRLQSLLSERSSSKSSQVLRERNESLKKEVEKLTKRLGKMEDSITRFAI